MWVSGVEDTPRWVGTSRLDGTERGTSGDLELVCNEAVQLGLTPLSSTSGAQYLRPRSDLFPFPKSDRASTTATADPRESIASSS